MRADTLSLAADDRSGTPLLEPAMEDGRRLAASPSLAEIRARAARSLAELPDPLRRLEAGTTYPVVVSERLVELAAEVDRRILGRHETPT